MPRFAAATVMEGFGDVLPVSYGNDRGVLVEFYKEVKTGKDYVSMRFAGDKQTDLRREVRESDKQRFPNQWRAYQEGTNQREGQTPIEELPFVDEASRYHLKSLNIFTAEALAGVQDGHLKNIGTGARKLRDKAQEFVANKEKVEAYDAKEAELNEMRERIAQLEANQKKTPGRKPKTA